MSRAPTPRALYAMFRTGLLDAFAYRAEVIIWILATTMPIVMLLLWSAAAGDGSIGRYDDAGFRAYFLAAFIVREVSGSWVAWHINAEVRDGTLALRLLRPAHPMWHYAMDQAAHVPVRAMFSLPPALLYFLWDPAIKAPSDWRVFAAFAVSAFLAWVLSFCLHAAIGFLAFFTEQSNKIMELWTCAFFVASGYLVPLDLFPPGARALFAHLPLRFQLGFSVELLTGQHTFASSLPLLLEQLGWVVAAALFALAVFRLGVRRFEAYGG